MTDMTDADAAAQMVRAFAQARGLGRAYALYPDAVAAAVARGTGALSSLPAHFSPVTEPAISFDPAKLDSRT